MNLKNLDTKEISRLIVNLKAELELRAKTEKARLVDEIREKSAALNISIDELMSDAKKKPRKQRGKATKAKAKRKTSAVKPKYRNPMNPAETWSGRGRKPKWVVALLESGRRLEDFLIQQV
ncbi:MAG: H-NS histone family protein [Cellvibrionales bacterium]|nr:H-NS histone family protein [Cellvibrionales bacterium]